MPEYTGVDYEGLQKYTSDWLGWGRSSAQWDDTDTERLDEIIQGGYSLYVDARSIDGQIAGHDWTWRRPVETLTTVANQWTYDLPAAFGACLGPLTWAATDGSQIWHIPIVGEGMIRNLRQGHETTGRPTHAAERPKPFSPTAGQRREMLLFPTPDAEYVFTYPMSAVPVPLTSTNKYPLGGAQFSELLKAACLAKAESLHRRGETAKQAEYVVALQHAISIDLRNVPDSMGSMHTGRWERGSGNTYAGRHYLPGSTYTHNGTAYP